MKVYSDNLRKELVKTLGRGMKKSEAAYLFRVKHSSVKRYVRACSIPSLAQGKDDRGVEMTKVVLLYRTDLSHSVKTHPWCIRI